MPIQLFHHSLLTDTIVTIDLFKLISNEQITKPDWRTNKSVNVISGNPEK